MKNSKSKQLLYKLFLIRTKYEYTGKILTKLLRDHEMHFIFFSENREEFYNFEMKNQFGNSNSKGQLQYELDKDVDSILSRLKKDFPYFSKEDIAIFCYSAAGFPDYLIARFANISSPKRVSARRSQLRELLKSSDREWREIYLAMLSTTLPDHERGRDQNLA